MFPLITLCPSVPPYFPVSSCVSPHYPVSSCSPVFPCILLFSPYSPVPPFFPTILQFSCFMPSVFFCFRCILFIFLFPVSSAIRPPVYSRILLYPQCIFLCFAHTSVVFWTSLKTIKMIPCELRIIQQFNKQNDTQKFRDCWDQIFHRNSLGI